MVLSVDRTCQCYPWYSGHTLVYLRAASPQNLALPDDFYFTLSVPLERSCRPCIRWCETGGFQDQGQCFFNGLSYSIPTIVFYYFSLSLLSVYRLVCGAGVFGLIGSRSLFISHSFSQRFSYPMPPLCTTLLVQ